MWGRGIRVFLTISFFWSCSRTELFPEEIETYVLDESNGLVQEKEYEDSKVQLIYRPASLMAWQEIKNVEKPSQAYIDSIQNKYDRRLYFILNLSKNGEDLLNESAGTPKFSQDLGVVSFGMGNSIRLFSSERDTVPLTSYQYSRMYGVSGTTSFLLVFDYGQWKKNEWIEVLLEEERLGVSRQKLRFRCSDLLKVPALKIEFKK